MFSTKPRGSPARKQYSAPSKPARLILEAPGGTCGAVALPKEARSVCVSVILMTSPGPLQKWLHCPSSPSEAPFSKLLGSLHSIFETWWGAGLGLSKRLRSLDSNLEPVREGARVFSKPPGSLDSNFETSRIARLVFSKRLEALHSDFATCRIARIDFRVLPDHGTRFFEASGSA